MVWVCYTTLLFVTVVLADFYVDNANTSVIYSMSPSRSGQGWQTFSVDTQQLVLQTTNSTGNYSITLDASHCYDHNYALGVCGSGDSCYVQIPFVGSGITMYVFSAGISGPPPPTYQVSNVSMYNIQGLASGFHNMMMTVLDWGGAATSMKFDYAYVNETFVAPRTASLTSTALTSPTSLLQSQSQTPTQSSTGTVSASKKIDLGLVVGCTVGGVAASVVLATCLSCLCKRHALKRKEASPLQVNPFTSERHGGPNVSRTPCSPHVQYQHEAQRATLYARHPETSASINPFQLALGAGTLCPTTKPRSQSTVSGTSSWGVAALHPTRRLPSNGGDGSADAAHSSAAADSPFADSRMLSPSPQPNLTAAQLEVIDRLREDKVPAETIARVIEGFAPLSGSFSFLGSDPSSARAPNGESILSTQRPPSYQTEIDR